MTKPTTSKKAPELQELPTVEEVDPAEAYPLTATPGDRCGGEARPPSPLGWGHLWHAERLVPPFPGPRVVPLVSPPSPPLLDGADSVDEWVSQVLSAWVMTVRWMYPRTAFKKSKGYKVEEVEPNGVHRAHLEAACWALFEEEAPPAMWARFQLELWRSKPREKIDVTRVPMPWRWCWEAKRIHEQARWFQRQSSTYGATSVILGREHRALIVAWRAMERELIETGAHEAQNVRAVVAKHFPGSTWAKMVASARAEVDVAQRELTRQFSKGAWQWA